MKITKIEKKMLGVFANGWHQPVCNQVPGSWNTYYSLVRKGLIESVSQRVTVLTYNGFRELAKQKEKNT